MGRSKRTAGEELDAASKAVQPDLELDRTEQARAGSANEAEGLSFEAALDQLESKVSQLEAGDMPLEEALELFEGGVALSRQCAATLETAERRIEILVAERDGEWQTEAFETDELDDDSDEEDFED